MANHSETTDRQRVLHEFASRLNEALDDLGAPQRGRIPGRQPWLAKRLHKSQRGVGKWIIGEGMPKQEDQAPLADFLGVRVEWLIFGLGPKHGNRLRERVSQVITDSRVRMTPRQKKALIDKIVQCLERPENSS